MAFGSGVEHFEVPKTLQRGSYTPKKIIKKPFFFALGTPYGS
jgi:hypothetical protein